MTQDKLLDYEKPLYTYGLTGKEIANLLFSLKRANRIQLEQIYDEAYRILNLKSPIVRCYKCKSLRLIDCAEGWYSCTDCGWFGFSDLAFRQSLLEGAKHG